MNLGWNYYRTPDAQKHKEGKTLIELTGLQLRCYEDAQSPEWYNPIIEVPRREIVYEISEESG
jgi:hypothetical protein